MGAGPAGSRGAAAAAAAAAAGLDYWRERSKAGADNDARIINTSSPSGIYGNVGQTNYGAAMTSPSNVSVPFGLLGAISAQKSTFRTETRKAHRDGDPHAPPPT